jgi:hypothetical protein
VVLGVSGWVTAVPGDYAAPWAGLASPDAEAYALAWESRELLGLSRALGALLLQQAAGQGASYALRHFSYAGAGLVAALGPTLLLGTATGLLIENAWAVAMERAAKGGKLLAGVLLAGAAGGRPVTLVGHGMGARLVWFALLELARQGARGARGFSPVSMLCLAAQPNPAPPSFPRPGARLLFAGRTGDSRAGAVGPGPRCLRRASRQWVLPPRRRAWGLLRGSTGWMRAAAGMAPVEGVQGLENADLTRLVDGHLDYLRVMPEVLDCIGFS